MVEVIVVGFPNRERADRIAGTLTKLLEGEGFDRDDFEINVDDRDREDHGYLMIRGGEEPDKASKIMELLRIFFNGDLCFSTTPVEETETQRVEM